MKHYRPSHSLIVASEKVEMVFFSIFHMTQRKDDVKSWLFSQEQ